VVYEIIADSPHTAEAICRESPEKLAKNPHIIVARSIFFNESPNVNAGL
jgi:hypothetical protein